MLDYRTPISLDHRAALFQRLQISLIALFCFSMYIYGNTFPLGLHYDETKKVRFILTQENDFRHPLLLLQLSRIANAVLQLQDHEQVVIMVRTIVAIAGMFLVIGLYQLSKTSLGHYPALFYALAVGSCPTIVVHSHYAKEDILLASCLIWTLVCFVRFLTRPKMVTAIAFGIACGLSFSTHYKSLLFLLVAAPFTINSWFQFKRFSLLTVTVTAAPHYYILIAGVSILTFFSINWQIAIDPLLFLRGSRAELKHAIDGHGSIQVHALPNMFCYHLIHNVFDGMTLPFAVCSIAGSIIALFNWHKLNLLCRILLLFSFLFYIVPEISPNKPPPDDGRYMIPVVVSIGFFSAWLLSRLLTFNSIANRIAIALLFPSMMAFSWYDSFNLISNLNHDTRQIAEDWIGVNIASDMKIDWQPLSASIHVGPIKGIDLAKLQQSNTDLVVVSSFQYERYLVASEAEGHPDEVYDQSRAFSCLFRNRFIEIRPNYRSYAFSNPIVRIVIMRQ